jgi:poly-beta-1,6-N-acetyl-D-glucosamine N-deacetylase
MKRFPWAKKLTSLSLKVPAKGHLRIPVKGLRSQIYLIPMLGFPSLGFGMSWAIYTANSQNLPPFFQALQDSQSQASQAFRQTLADAHLTVTPICNQGQAIGLKAASTGGVPVTPPIIGPVTGAVTGPAPKPSANDATGQDSSQGIKLLPSSALAPWKDQLTTWQTQLTPAPSPQLHGRARLAQVPVMMYHDILPEKLVSFDVTPEELEADFKLIRDNGLTPISLAQLVTHLRNGTPLPAKPIVLTFDDGYAGHYTHVFQLMKQYNIPATFAIYPSKVGTKKGRSSLSWEQLKEMAANPLVTIASHSLTHPVLPTLTDAQLRSEVIDSKQQLETQLGIKISHFIYPEGKYDDRVKEAVIQAGYQTAWTMNDEKNLFAEQSKDLFSLERIGQSELETILEAKDIINGGPDLRFIAQGQKNLPTPINRYDPVELKRITANNVPLILASGGQPQTIHPDSRYQVSEIIENTPAIAAVDGTFFSLDRLDSNKVIGPILSKSTNQFVPGTPPEIKAIQKRPLVLINGKTVQFIPFDASQHNSHAGLEQALPGVTDAFVAAAWLVRDGQAQPPASFGSLYHFQEARDRAFWGIDWANRPVVGVSADFVGSVDLGQALQQAGIRDAVMLDSGASTSLVYQGESMMSYDPRPVPHSVALMPPIPTANAKAGGSCPVPAAQ